MLSPTLDLAIALTSVWVIILSIVIGTSPMFYILTLLLSLLVLFVGIRLGTAMNLHSVQEIQLQLRRTITSRSELNAHMVQEREGHENVILEVERGMDELRTFNIHLENVNRGLKLDIERLQIERRELKDTLVNNNLRSAQIIRGEAMKMRAMQKSIDIAEMKWRLEEVRRNVERGVGGRAN